MKNKELAIQKEKLELDKDIAKKGRVKDYALGAVGTAAKVATAFIPGGKTAKAVTTGAKVARGARAAGKALRNDPKWYLKVQGTTNVSAAVPTYFKQGIPKSYPGTNLFGDARIAVINYVNSIGTDVGSSVVGSQSDVQFALSYFYSQTLQNNSRVPTEEAPEFGMYLFSWIDVAHALETMKKAIAVSTKFVDQNAAYGKALVEAIGFDYDDLIANRANYISRLNMMIAEFNINAAIPKSMAYFDRKMYLAKAILRDTDSEIGSVAIYRQISYWQFDTETNACKIINFGRYGGTPKLMGDWMKNVSGMILALKEAQVCNNIKANILSAIPVSNLITLEPLVDAVTLANTYFIDSDLEREQMANITTLPQGFAITEDTLGLHVTTEGYLIQGASETNGGIVVTSGSVSISGDRETFCQTINRVIQMLNFYHDDVTPEDVIEASRFKYLLTAGSGSTLKVLSAGTEVVWDIAILNGTSREGNVPTLGKNYVEAHTVVFPKLSTSTNTVPPGLSQKYLEYYGFTLLTGFDWCPLVAIMLNAIYYSTTDSKWYYLGSDTYAGNNADTYYLVGDIGKVVNYPEGNIKINNSQANKSLFMVDREVFKQGF